MLNLHKVSLLFREQLLDKESFYLLKLLFDIAVDIGLTGVTANLLLREAIIFILLVIGLSITNITIIIVYHNKFQPEK